MNIEASRITFNFMKHINCKIINRSNGDARVRFREIECLSVAFIPNTQMTRERTRTKKTRRNDKF